MESVRGLPAHSHDVYVHSALAEPVAKPSNRDVLDIYLLEEMNTIRCCLPNLSLHFCPLPPRTCTRSR